MDTIESLMVNCVSLSPRQSIPNFEELPCTAATRAIVASKNRFLNILPIDTTRVILNLLHDDPATDYINGNYISVGVLTFESNSVDPRRT